jgi:hypothetical protein
VRRPATAALIALAFAIAGCGGSSTSAHDQFIARANAACAKALVRAKRLAPKSEESPTVFFAHAEELIAELGRTLSRVSPPPSQRVAYRRLIASIEREVGYIRQLRLNGANVNNARGRAVLKKMEANTVNHEAAALGLAKCGQTVEPSG